MEANELRIGNYYENNGARQITPADIDFCHRNEESFNKLNAPIPLTDDWLNDFGFKKDGAYWSHLNLNIQISETKTGGEILLVPNRKYALELSHIHSLQNLFFALTGEELIRKQNVSK